MTYEAHVGNIGRIGTYPTKEEAIKEVKETITNSGRADNYGFVLDSSGNLVADDIKVSLRNPGNRR